MREFIRKAACYMKILDRKGLSGIVKYLLDLVFLGGLAIMIGLPFILNWYIGQFRTYVNEKYWFLLPFLYITGLLALVIVFELRMFFKTLNKRDPFTMRNVKGLNRMAFSSFAIALMYVVKIAFFNSFLTIILAMVFVIAGLFALILGEVFRQAVIVKEENDLTI
jgi:hypothetical protein